MKFLKLNKLLLLSIIGLALVSCEPSEILVSNTTIPSVTTTTTTTTTTTDPTTNEDITFSITSMNDLHGAVMNDGTYVPGISSVSGFYKSTYDTNDIHLANGDMWQGTAESNLNKGSLIMEWMELLDFSAMNLGNHEFDWGTQYIEDNIAASDIPFITSNIYNKIDGAITTRAEQLGDSSIIIDHFGFQIGVIGSIGKDQYSSINSLNVGHLAFLEEIDVIKEESRFLREKGVDLIVLEIHADISTVENTELVQDVSGSDQPYVDIVFGGHSHQSDSKIINGVPLLMGYANGSQVSEVEISVDKNGDFSIINYEVKNIAGGYADQETNNLIAKYDAIQNQVLNEVVGYTSSWLDTSDVAQLSANSMLDYAINSSEYTDVEISITNSARNSIKAGEILYRDVYRALPFENQICIANVKGSEITSQLRYNYASFADGVSTSIVSNKIYKVAVIDYLVYHTNDDGIYDYFPSAEVTGSLDKVQHELMVEYFKANNENL